MNSEEMEIKLPDKLAQDALELCWEIEKFPASEHQTATSEKASRLHDDLVWFALAVQAAIPRQRAARSALEMVGKSFCCKSDGHRDEVAPDVPAGIREA